MYSDNQKWVVTDIGNAVWTIRPVHSDKSLDVSGWSKNDGAAIHQWSYTGYLNQQWKIHDAGNSFKIASAFSKLYLTVNGKDNGSGVYQSADKSSSSQRWYFNPVSGNCGSESGDNNDKNDDNNSSAAETFMGKYTLMIGSKMETQATATSAPFDMRYQYIHSKMAPYDACYKKCYDGCSSNYWWGCWTNWNQSPSGEQVKIYLDGAASATWDNKSRPQIMSITWYSLRDLGDMGGYGDGPGEVAVINKKDLLTKYMNDYRFFLKQFGNATAMIHLEPDFWGYVHSINRDPRQVPAVVRASNPTDCAQEENNAAGLASCLISMAKKYAPNTTVGLAVSCWNIAMEGGIDECVAFNKALGAGKGDYIGIGAADRDAAWAEIKRKNSTYWWDDAAFWRFLKYAKTTSEKINNKPIVVWQIPLGNAAQNNTNNHWKDNKVQYFFDNIYSVADAHIAALLFGDGHGEQTNIKTDGGYLARRTLEYYKKGGAALK
ncbi:MAG: RICIN domain-containing protein [Reinekea sp.]